MEGANKNAQYTSPQVQNELIGIAEEVLRDRLSRLQAIPEDFLLLLMKRQTYQARNNSLLEFDLLKK